MNEIRTDPLTVKIITIIVAITIVRQYFYPTQILLQTGRFNTNGTVGTFKMINSFVFRLKQTNKTEKL